MLTLASFLALQKGYLAVDSDLYLKLFPVAAAKVREGGEPGETIGAKEARERGPEEGRTKGRGEATGSEMAAAAVVAAAGASPAVAASAGNNSVVQATKEMAAVVMMPQVEIPDEKDQRFSVLSYEQVKRLSDLMSDNISIHGRGNFPTIEVKLCDLVAVVKKKLEEDGVKVREIRLNGSGASSVLATSGHDIAYNDLDLIFSLELTTGKAYDKVKCAVLESLMHLLPEGVSRKRMSTCSLKEAYVSKMVKVNDSDRWSLITLGNNRSKSVELKFVDSMRRQYEFSVDSFHILLDTLFLFYECASDTPIGDNFYPTVVGESMYGDFHAALFHLHKKLVRTQSGWVLTCCLCLGWDTLRYYSGIINNLFPPSLLQISTKNPEEIRGGGLLKYCNLLCKAYQPARPEEVKNMERYMCSRFFIDFPDVRQQQAKLENYLYNHFHSSEDRLKHDYLMILYQVVDESTVCLMGHERRLTLGLIEELAYQIYCPPPEAGYYHPATAAAASAANATAATTTTTTQQGHMQHQVCRPNRPSQQRPNFALENLEEIKRSPEENTEVRIYYICSIRSRRTTCPWPRWRSRPPPRRCPPRRAATPARAPPPPTATAAPSTRSASSVRCPSPRTRPPPRLPTRRPRRHRRRPPTAGTPRRRSHQHQGRTHDSISSLQEKFSLHPL